MSEDSKAPKAPVWYERYMLLVATGGNAFFYIQSIKIFLSESATDVSLWGFVVAFMTVGSWFVYGVFYRDKIIMLANVIAMIGAGSVVAGCLIYG